MTTTHAQAALTRLVLSARAACGLAILGLALTVTRQPGLGDASLVCAIAVVASILQRKCDIQIGWVAVGEAAACGMVIGANLPAAAVCLPYLLIPPLVAGCLSTVRTVLGAGAIEALTVCAPVVVAGRIGDTLAFAQQLSPWILTGLGVGALGARLRAIGPVRRGDDVSYESARRLIGQLRGLAGALPMGLDVVGMAQEVLADVHSTASVKCSALFVPGITGELTLLAGSEDGCKMVAYTSVALLDECLEGQHPVERTVHRSGQTLHVVGLPLVIEQRLIAVVLVGFDDDANSRTTIGDLASTVERYTLRLDTALAFEQVRCLATSEERRRLAGEIHDGIAQDAAGLAFLVEEIAAEAQSSDQRKQLVQLRNELRRFVSDLRLTIYDLRSGTTETDGLSPALYEYIQGVTKKSSMRVHFAMDDTQYRLPAEQEAGLLRIAQEAITNACKHSGGANIWVRCEVDPSIASLVIEDDGRWKLGAKSDGSFGLPLMRERAERINAQVSIAPRAGGGTRVAVSVGRVQQPNAWRRESHVYATAVGR